MLACVTLGPVGQTIAFSCAVCAQNDFQSASFPGWLEDGGEAEVVAACARTALGGAFGGGSRIGHEPVLRRSTTRRE